MLNNRIIPCLQLIGDSLVKKVKFDKHSYIGDPINTVRIFNELEVDELCFLDISATTEKRKPNLKVLKEIANECFMPLSYGGGIENIQTVHEILSIGFEKIILNTSAFKNPKLITEIVNQFGSQSLIISIDVKKNIFGKYSIYTNCGKVKQKGDPLEWSKTVEKLGAGELLITSMDREGTWQGYDLKILKEIADSVNIPVIANGGAGNIDHIIEVFENTEIAAVAVGSMLVYQAKGLGVLVNFPDKKKLEIWNK
jgi:cyclase